MNIILLSYCVVTLVWFSLWFVHRNYWRGNKHVNQSLGVLLGSTALIAVAWFANNIWISGVGMLIAVTGVSALFNIVQGKSKRLLRNGPTLLVWFTWFVLLSLTLAHVIILCIV